VVGNRGWGRFIGTSSFSDALDYITREGDLARDHETPLAVWSANVASIETAALEMEVAASQSRAKDPLYHLIVSWDEGERPTYEQAHEALDTQLRHLGFKGLQCVAALQDDGLGGKVHLHAIINRVDPRTNVARDVWQDHGKIRAACRETEQEQGWRSAEFGQRPELSRGARDIEYYGHKRSFERRVHEEIAPAVCAALEAGGSWSDLHRVCAEHNVRYEPVYREGQDVGGRLVGKERGEYARARELGPELTHRKLVERLGPFERGAERRATFGERCAAAASDVAELRGSGGQGETGWREVHATFERHGVGYERYRTGARLVDLDSPETARTKDFDRKLALGEMTKSFGAFETSQVIKDREAAREAVQHAESLAVGAQLIANPAPLLERLTATNATFTLTAVQKIVAEKVVDRDQQAELVATIVDQSVELRDERDKARFTTTAVLEAEQTGAEAAIALADSRRNATIARPAAERLDAQQQGAYAYAIADDARLKVITGVPGAGKTTLISEVAAAYRDAGYNVRAVSVANSAVDVLRRETDVPGQSIAKQLYEWSQGRERLGDRDLLIIDEVSTLGTAQGAALLKEANDRGAVVLALGDDKQFQAVAHGNALALMQRAVGEHTVDLQTTRRQREGWQREATHAVRRGDVREAIEAYRDHGAVHEVGTQADAREAIVARWRAIEETGVECGIEAFTNKERIGINALARDEWRAMGRLEGRERMLETVDGKTPYAVGDRVVVRETINEAGLFNGSVGVVRGIRNDTLQIERRDGKVVDVDTREHAGVQHAYCSTEYREQGSTRYAELQLVTEHVNNRSLTVGMTRHTDDYEMFYSREAVGSFDELVALGERTRSKELALDYALVERRREPEREREELTMAALRDRVDDIAKGFTVEPYDREERRAAFTIHQAIAHIDDDKRVMVLSDPHDMLANEGEIVLHEIGEIKEQVKRERELGRVQERGYGSELGR